MNELEEKIDKILDIFPGYSIEVLNAKEELLSLFKEEVDKAVINVPKSINFCSEVRENKRHLLADVEFIKKYRDLFPKDKKGDLTGVTAKMKQFFDKNKDYNQDDVLLATRKYINSQKRDFTYCVFAHYFILKNGISLLAAICEENKSRGIKVIEDLKSNFEDI